MSMSTHVEGFIPPADQWLKMKAALDACIQAGVPPPNEVAEFFNEEEPDPLGVAISLEDKSCCRPFHADMQDGFEIDITKLPPHINIIRFYNSY